MSAAHPSTATDPVQGHPLHESSSRPISPLGGRPQINLFTVNTVLNDVELDPSRVNIAALEGISIPTRRAVEITRDAIKAAREYYDLFFEEAEAAAATSAADEGLMAADAGVACSGAATKHGSSCSSTQGGYDSSDTSSLCSSTAAGTKDVEAPNNRVSRAEDTTTASHSHSRHQHHHHDPSHRHHARSGRDPLASPVNVRNTNYHTFFPPPLTHRQRKHIIHRIIGRHHARPFSQWAWRKAEEYHVLHARTVAQHQGGAAVTAAAASPSLVAQGRRLSPASSTAAAAAAVAHSCAVSTAAMTHTTSKPGSVPSGCTHAPSASMSATTTASAPMTAPPLQPQPQQPTLETVQRGANAASEATEEGVVGPHRGDHGFSRSPMREVPSSACAEGAQVGDIYRQILRTSSSAVAVNSTEGKGCEAARLVREAAAAAPGSSVYRDPNATATASGSSHNPISDAGLPAAVPVGIAVHTTSTPSPREVSDKGNSLLVGAAAANAASTSASADGMRGKGHIEEGSVAHAAAKSDTAMLCSCSLPSPLLNGGSTVTFDEESAMYTIPASQQGPEYFAATAEDGTKTLIIVMVGLPARGKTFMAQKIARLLGWHGTKAKVQNIQVAWRRALLDWAASQHRVDAMRELNGSGQPLTSHTSSKLSAPASSTLVAVEDAPAAAVVAEADEDALAAAGTAAAGGGTATAAEAGSNGGSGGPAPCLRAAHFERLLTDPQSIERRLYRQVLKGFATDCQLFFAGGGEVVVVNDDFITEDLRDEAEALFKPLAGSLVYMEVMRDAKQNKRFNECKVKDPTEYPRDRISMREAKRDFGARLELLERMYEPLADARGDGSSDDIASRSDLATTAAELSVAEGGGGGEGGQAGNGSGGASSAERPRRTACSPKSYIKIRNSDMIETHGIHGYLASRIISYVMNLSQVKIQHPIYFARHGQSCYNLEDRIGGNPLLTDQGMRDAAALLEFMDSLKTHLEHIDSHQRQRSQLVRGNEIRRPQNAQQREGQATADSLTMKPAVRHTSASSCTSTQPPANLSLNAEPGSAGSGAVGAMSGEESAFPPSTGGGARANSSVTAAAAAPLFSPHTNVDNSSANNLEIWTSQLRRAIQTAELSERLLNIKTLRWSSLNEIHAGVCEDMTYAEVREEYPLIEQFRKRSKYTFRYPEGESYQDLVVRLEPVIMELENADKVVVVVAHQAVLRCLLAYFGSTSAESSIRVEVPHRTVWRCTYDSRGIASLEELRLDNLEAGFQKTPKHNGSTSGGGGGGGGTA